MMTTEEKILDSQQIALPLPDNIGITQSSGLDHHAVFSRQRVDVFKDEDIASTQSARQHKDATDLVCQPTYQQAVGTIGYTDHKGVNNQFVSEDKCIVERTSLIRRLTPFHVRKRLSQGGYVLHAWLWLVGG